MGALLRCSSCSREMVLESYHAGRSVPCPWCSATNDVPLGLDFAGAAQAGAKDEARGGVLLLLAVIGVLTVVCIPLSAWVWWAAHGALGRAADEGRPAEGMLRAARAVAMVATILQGIGLLLYVVRSF